MGSARHRMDRRALRRGAPGVDDAAGRRSRVASQASARRFAATAGLERTHGTHAALAADPDGRHRLRRHPAPRAPRECAPRHRGWQARARREAVGPDATEAQAISGAASAAGVFCMEAMWTLFLPRTDVVRQVLEAGLLGDVRTVLADHGEHFDPPHRILDPAMAGGSLLDLGSYLTTLATWVLGPASQVRASGEMTASGVNGQTAMLLTHAGGATSVLHTTLLSRTPTSATIAGTAATLTLPGPFFQPGDVVLTSADGSRAVTWTDPEPIGHGALFHSALEAARCIGEGLVCSPCTRRSRSSRRCSPSTRSAVRSGSPTTECPATPDPHPTPGRTRREPPSRRHTG